MKHLLFIIFCIVCSCKTSKEDSKGLRDLIEARWKLTIKYQVNYPTIEFKNGGAVFNSLSDTIYGFSYKLKNRNLILYDRINPETLNKIVKLTYDSLVFGNLLEHKTPQIYVRENK